MKAKTSRLFFIDAMRTWAILMMLQGHFIDGLLAPVYRNPENMAFNVWLYFRGITAPVFFTVSGFIFTHLLVRVPQRGLENPRVKKGVRRGLQLLFIGYLLRVNLFGLFSGHIYDSFYLVDVLHCIGFSILSIIGVYLISIKRNQLFFPMILLLTTVVMFLFEPVYKQWSFSFLPNALANYFTKANGSVFTIIPWLGYTSMGSFLALLFFRFKDFRHLYPVAISIAVSIGLALIFCSSGGFLWLNGITGIPLLRSIEQNNYLFIRLGDVFMVFAVFMVLRNILTHRVLLHIGSSTLSIYVIHFIILYGSFTGLGLYRFFHHSMAPWVVVPGALAFMFSSTYLALMYNKHETEIRGNLNVALEFIRAQGMELYKYSKPFLKDATIRVRLVVNKVLGTVKN